MECLWAGLVLCKYWIFIGLFSFSFWQIRWYDENKNIAYAKINISLSKHSKKVSKIKHRHFKVLFFHVPLYSHYTILFFCFSFVFQCLLGETIWIDSIWTLIFSFVSTAILFVSQEEKNTFYSEIYEVCFKLIKIALINH